MSNHIIVGCGGIGGWVVPLLSKMKPKDDKLILMDGDTVEAKNFDRQMFLPEHLGWNKAEALAATYGIEDFLPRYLQKDTRPEIQEGDWVWCCADNHPARAECLAWADDLYVLSVDHDHVYVVIGGNEYEYQEAYIYMPAWKELALADPRCVFPEILTDKTGDPAYPDCTGLAQKANPQLALFNYLAAGSMVHLWLFHTKWSDETEAENWPIGHSANRVKMQTKVMPTLTEILEETHRNR